MTPKNIYRLFILLSVIISLNCYSDNLLAPKKISLPIGEWVAKIDNVGNVAIKCREYSKKVSCTVFWVFSELKFSAKLENGNLKLFNKDSEEDYLLLSLVGSFSKKSSYDQNPSHKAPHKILQSGFLTSEYFLKFKSATFKEGDYDDIADFKRYRSDYNKYNDAGHLKKLPDSFPAWFINPTAYLFLNETDGSGQRLDRILEHKNLTPGTLKYICNILLTKRKELSPFNLVAIASNPSTSKEVLKLLFNTQESSSLAARIWNAVSNNPNAPVSYKKEYIDRIKNGSKKLQENMLYDETAAPELLDWIARNGKIDFFSYSPSRIFSHRNIWPKTLDYLARRFPYDDAIETIAENSNTSDKTLIKLAKRKIKGKFAREKILKILSNSYDRSPEAATIALAKLIKSGSLRLMLIAAENPHLTKNQIDIFITSDFLRLRQALAKNKALKVSDLKKLAKDDYSHVAEAARDHLKSSYPIEYKKILPSLKALSSLNPAYGIHNELQRATFTNDTELVEKLIKKYERIQAPPYNINIDHVLKGNNKELQKILLEVTPPRKTAQEKFKGFMKNFMEALPALVFVFGAGVIVVIIIFVDMFITRNSKSKSNRPYVKWSIVFILSLFQVGCWSVLEKFNGAFGDHSQSPYLPIFIMIVIFWAIYRSIRSDIKENKAT